jgi:O-antigen/teichoic acid export membrane protein
MARKILKLTVAYAASSINQILIQLITVPIFVMKTNFADYATWLIAYNFALFTSVLDFGQVTSSQNSFRVLALQNKQNEVIGRTKNLNTFLTLTYFSYFVILCVLNKIFPQGLSMTLLGALIYLNLLQAVFGVFEAVFRSKGRPAFGIYASNSLRLSEFLGVLTVLILFSNSLISIAICAIVSKTLVFITIVFVQRKHFTILNFSFIDFPILKSSLKEGVPFLMSKMSDWLIISGVVISLANKISPTNLVLFVASRTFFRLGWQLSSVVSSSFLIAINNAWAENNTLMINKLKNRNMRITLVITIVGSVGYLTMGKPLFEYWVKNQIQLENDIFLIGIAYSVALSISHAQKTVFNSMNRNFFISVASLFSAIAVNFEIRYSEAPQSLLKIYILLVIVEMISFLNVLVLGRRILNKLLL